MNIIQQLIADSEALERLALQRENARLRAIIQEATTLVDEKPHDIDIPDWEMLDDVMSILKKAE